MVNMTLAEIEHRRCYTFPEVYHVIRFRAHHVTGANDLSCRRCCAQIYAYPNRRTRNYRENRFSCFTATKVCEHRIKASTYRFALVQYNLPQTEGVRTGLPGRLTLSLPTPFTKSQCRPPHYCEWLPAQHRPRSSDHHIPSDASRSYHRPQAPPRSHSGDVAPSAPASRD